jgi:protein-tyrosine phosphatase
MSDRRQPRREQRVLLKCRVRLAQVSVKPVDLARDMFRNVGLPEYVGGRLYLHSMPGWHEPVAVTLSEIEQQGVEEIVCLAPADDLRDTAPAYLEAIRKRCLPCKHTWLEIEDFATGDERALATLASEVADSLENGRTILVHCAAGIGRSGTFAIAVLLKLGIALETATKLVENIGSHPETDGQRQFLKRFAHEIRSAF